MHVGEALPTLYPGEEAFIELTQAQLARALRGELVTSDASTIWQIRPAPGWRMAIKRCFYRWFGYGI